ncbi:hypothetical protein CDAR_39461 [Caerostris darwini]|uniref:Uncharacterized protein n=1 Tax=Caerostris darwini TaxID=1538125 RepID=A0AAV4U6A8_9ARAC|nr:hypothetical protein CDAR_39461 [Caerostris darwini]
MTRAKTIINDLRNVKSIFFIGYADKKTCIQNVFNTEIGDQGYRTCYDRSAALVIPRIKQVITASNGQMTVDRTKFATLGSNTSNTKVGKAIQACAAEDDDRLYQEAAKAVQCVFEEIKKIC